MVGWVVNWSDLSFCGICTNKAQKAHYVQFYWKINSKIQQANILCGHTTHQISFCSERYRDLIEAADTITEMKHSAENVSEVFRNHGICAETLSSISSRQADVETSNWFLPVVSFRWLSLSSECTRCVKEWKATTDPRHFQPKNPGKSKLWSKYLFERDRI